MKRLPRWVPIDLGGPAVIDCHGPESQLCAVERPGMCVVGAARVRDGSATATPGTSATTKHQLRLATSRSAAVRCDLSLGNIHSCAVLSDGAVRCWGGNVRPASWVTPMRSPFGANLGDDETPDTMRSCSTWDKPVIRVAAGGRA